MNKRLSNAQTHGATPKHRQKSTNQPPKRGVTGIIEGRKRADRGIEGKRRGDGGRSATGDERGEAGGGPGVGGGATTKPPRQGTTRGAPAFALRGLVRNMGSGVWGFGSIIGWIPADVRPWHYCRRMGWKQIFSRQTMPLAKARPYVFGDDGRYHLPERWRVV